jgi:hypothetical protein
MVGSILKASAVLPFPVIDLSELVPGSADLNISALIEKG